MRSGMLKWWRLGGYGIFQWRGSSIDGDELIWTEKFEQDGWKGCTLDWSRIITLHGILLCGDIPSCWLA